MKYEKELKRILTKLVSLETTAGNYDAIDAAYEYISSELSWYPFKVKTYVSNQVKSVVWSTEAGLHSHIILNAHLDVVPGKQELFSLKETSGNWKGRGVMDMKFSIAVFITALKQIYETEGYLPSISIMITSDEEIGGANGVNYLINKIGYTADIVLIPDGGSNWHVVKNAKGVLQLAVKVIGSPSHASEPWSGISANDKLIENLASLRSLYPQYESPTQNTTLVIGKIAGGEQTNQVSGSSIAYLDIRYPDVKNRVNILREVTKLFGKDNIDVLVSANPFSTKIDNSYIQQWSKLVSKYQADTIFINEYGASDGRYFSSKNIPVIVSQPIGGLTHGDGEYINIKSLVDYTNVLIDWIKILNLG